MNQFSSWNAQDCEKSWKAVMIFFFFLQGGNSSQENTSIVSNLNNFYSQLFSPLCWYMTTHWLIPRLSPILMLCCCQNKVFQKILQISKVRLSPNSLQPGKMSVFFFFLQNLQIASLPFTSSTNSGGSIFHEMFSAWEQRIFCHLWKLRKALRSTA